MKPDRLSTPSLVLITLFVGGGAALGLAQLLQGEISRALLGLAAAAFLVIPWGMRRFGLAHPNRLYCILFGFCILAYDVGCVYQRFDAWPFFDKISHFLSGIVFTILGFCLYLLLARPQTLKERPWLSCSYALFFSAFVAVVWEICEYSGFLLTGHDSQHTLTTGVVDTMQDLISCLWGSLLSVAGFALFIRLGIRLITGPAVEEFHSLCRRRWAENGRAV